MLVATFARRMLTEFCAHTSEPAGKLRWLKERLIIHSASAVDSF